MLPEISIDNKYLINNYGTSDGTQIKYLYEDKWYKIDRYGGEGACEELASEILRLSGYSSDKYVTYKKVIINGDDGCVSRSFLKENESFISIYRLHLNVLGQDPAITTSTMDYDDAIDYIIHFVKNYTGIDITEYLADTLTLDAFILNEDRHYNNLGLIFNGRDYRPAPIFGNGKSLFVGNTRYNASLSISENKKIAFAKAFSGSFDLNQKHLEKNASLHLNYDKIKEYLRSMNLKDDNIYRRLYELISIHTISHEF